MMEEANAGYERRLCHLVETSGALMAALQTVRSLGLPSWCIGAGIIRALVWDALHDHEEPSSVDDVDVAYFDAGAAAGQEEVLRDRLTFLAPDVAWDVTNQATVHEWLVDASGQSVAPLNSLQDGIGTWPEYATCVGVYLSEDDVLKVIAPHGLDDLFQLRVRHNPLRASAATFMERVHGKRFDLRWPRLSVCIPCAALNESEPQ